jgi:predicted helicase
MPRFFPAAGVENWGFAVPAPGNSAPPFMALMVNSIPDLGLAGVSAVQFFPRYTFEESVSGGLLDALQGDARDYRRSDNVTDEILADYQRSFGHQVTKDDIFFYLYGLLHSPDYRSQFESDLRKMLPRIPKVSRFLDFSHAGRDLSELHLNYEEADPYPLKEHVSADSSFRVEKMKYAKNGRTTDKTTVIYNSGIVVSGIPEEAQRYMLGSRSAIDWVLERYRVKIDPASGILNDPNDWADEHGNPRYILDLLARIVTVSVETMKIVGTLPPLEVVS